MSDGRDVYRVRARRWEHGWELDIESVGATQSHSLKDAEMMARDYISLALDVPMDSFDLELVPDIGEGLAEQARQARAETRAAEKARDDAALKLRRVARMLHDEGLTGKEIGIILGVSTQRVSQLLKAEARARGGEHRTSA
ncbi:sigma factor-like helix-turn-helix DNA-binding protein [Actinomadura sp. NTSP31]|uniref:sigma factor-like helix-turn-helix DNA-binding protein n=1 Tax=Actinomadura sp. NTSP31 TaxID=1735447 RepID=UPI0035C053D0